MHPSRVLPALRHARFWREFLSALLFVSLLLPAHAAAPQWWAQRGVIAPNKARDDFAAINQGQLKNLAAKAVAEMNAKLTGGAGTALNQRVASWSTNTAQADDFAGVNIGQAKAVARPVYERLLAAGAITTLPSWITTPAASNQDFAAANIGQVKNLFAFEVPDQVGTSGAGGSGTGGSGTGGSGTGGSGTGGSGTGGSGTTTGTEYSPFVITYESWTAGRLNPNADNKTAGEVHGEFIGEITTYTLGFFQGDRFEPTKSTDVYVHAVRLSGATDIEAWKQANSTPMPKYKMRTNRFEEFTGENGLFAGGQEWESFTVIDPNPNGGLNETGPEVLVNEWGSVQQSTFRVERGLRSPRPTYSFTDEGNSWKVAAINATGEGTYDGVFIDPKEPDPMEVAHYMTAMGYGPATTSVNWVIPEPRLVQSPGTALGQMGSGHVIPFSPFHVPLTVSTVAISSSSLTKTTIPRNTSGGGTHDVYQGYYEHGKLNISWRSDFPVPLDENARKAWINRFLVMRTEINEVNGSTTVNTTTKPLSELVGENFTGSVLLSHLDAGAPQAGSTTAVIISLIPAGIDEVFERDQKWNKAPSPKHWVKPTPANYGYNDDEREGSTILTRTLFVAVEPSSGKVELDVKGAGGSSGTMQTLVGLKSHSGTMLNDVATMSGGVAHLDFTPANGINDGRHELCIGLDKNSNGKLDADEVVTFPQDKKFWIRAVTASDYSSNRSHVAWVQDYSRAVVGDFTADILNTFLGKTATLAGSTSTTTVTVPINRSDLTHIAGSTYNPTNGETTLDKFHLPDGSDATLSIEKTLDIGASAGLRGVLDETWNHYLSQFQAQLTSNPSLQTWTSGPLAIKPTNGSINCSQGGSEMPQNLTYSIGTSGITGTMNFTIQRNPQDSTKFYLKQLDVDCTVEDLLDYDWTRGPNSESRPAAIVEIGWQPPTRTAGKVFFVSIKVVQSYGTGALEKFNLAPGSGTTPPPAGTD
ncbi:MAG: hypothetical protein V4672_20640 [Verrucomicrobiota bacterium]